MYDIVYLPEAKKYLKKIKEQKLKEKYRDAIKTIRQDPFVGIPKKGNLAGLFGYDIRHAKTSYELAYYIYKQENDNGAVIIIMAGTRENFYEALKLS